MFDVLKEKYVSMTVGDVRSSLSSTMTDGLRDSLEDLRAQTDRSIKKTKRSLEQEMQTTIQEQTELITGGSGGHVVLKRDANGKPTDILVMDTENMNTATNVLRINVNGIGFSSHGINGPYGSAWTLDGRFSADYIQTGTLNANLIRAGIITDINNSNYWNLETGEFRLAATTTVGGSTVSAIASSAVSSYDTSLNQQAVFNKLTNNGQTQGIYLNANDNKLYINASYIQTGTLSANRIQGGTLTLGGSNNVNGQLSIQDSYGTVIGTWNKDGVNINSGSINIGNGKFTVSSSGALTSQDATINGSIYAKSTSENKWLKIDGGILTGAYNSNSQQGMIYFGPVYDNYSYGVWIEGNNYIGLYAPHIFVNNGSNCGRGYNGYVKCQYEENGYIYTTNMFFVNGILMEGI